MKLPEKNSSEYITAKEAAELSPSPNNLYLVVTHTPKNRLNLSSNLPITN